MNRLQAAALIILCVVAHTPLEGAPITWGAAFELVSDADLDLSFGPLVYAVNGGDNTGNEPLMTSPQPAVRTVTVGGTSIPFEGIEAVYGSAASFGMMGTPFETFGDAVDHLAGQPNNVTFATSNSRTVAIPQVTFDLGAATGLGARRYNVATGNADLDVILASQVFFDGRTVGSSALNISLNNLQVGRSYQLQLIGPAADSPRISQATVDDGAGNMASGLAGFLDLDNDGQMHVTSILGTFVADGTSQSVNVVLAADRNSGISGLILTTRVPEPTSALLLVLAAVCFAVRGRQTDAP